MGLRSVKRYMKDTGAQINPSDKEMVWTRLTKKKWQSFCGQFIIDYSFQCGGKRIRMYMLFRNQKELTEGNNYAVGETLTEAKQLAANDK